MPVQGIISGVYGSQRILNGKPKWPHYGIDIAAKKGTKIKSSATGIVTMAEPDLYYTGGTIIMDHGHGISTIYSHLENVLVSVGDKINQGDIILFLRNALTSLSDVFSIKVFIIVILTMTLDQV